MNLAVPSLEKYIFERILQKKKKVLLLATFINLQYTHVTFMLYLYFHNVYK